MTGCLGLYKPPPKKKKNNLNKIWEGPFPQVKNHEVRFRSMIFQAASAPTVKPMASTILEDWSPALKVVALVA